MPHFIPLTVAGITVSVKILMVLLVFIKLDLPGIIIRQTSFISAEKREVFGLS